jgi:hypothetical protein
MCQKKVNATTPKLIGNRCTCKAYFQLGITAKDKFLLETVGTNKFKVSNIGIREPVTGNLVYHQTKGDLKKLAWDFNIHTNHDHLEC